MRQAEQIEKMALAHSTWHLSSSEWRENSVVNHYGINALLPKDLWLPDEPMIHEVKFDDMDSDVRLPKVSFGKEYEYVEDSSVNIYDDNNDSAFFDADAAVELASNVAAAAVELAVGPAVVPTSGGGVGGSSSGWGDDDDDDEKKKRNRPKFHR